MRWLRDVMTYLKLGKLKYASCVRHGPCLHGNVHNKPIFLPFMLVCVCVLLFELFVVLLLCTPILKLCHLYLNVDCITLELNCRADCKGTFFLSKGSFPFPRSPNACSRGVWLLGFFLCSIVGSLLSWGDCYVIWCYIKKQNSNSTV